MAKYLCVAGLVVAFIGSMTVAAEGPRGGEGRAAVRVGPWELEFTGDVAGEAKRPVKLGEYWIGVAVYVPEEEALRTQLKLPKDQGLVVERVVPDSPAAKAGIERLDVLLSVGDKPLKEVQDLIDAVEAAKGENIRVRVIHDGQEKEVSLKPAKRPAEDKDAEREGSPSGDREDVERWLKRLLPGDLQKSMRFHYFHPGTILPRGAAVQPPLPDDMTVTITKKGAKPAQIAVQRGDKKWDVGEDDLTKLPEDVRPHVERMLGRVSVGPVRIFEPGPEWPHGPEMLKDRLVPRLPEGRLEKRLEEMSRRIDQLRKTIDEMREKRAEKKAEKPESPKAVEPGPAKGGKI